MRKLVAAVSSVLVGLGLTVFYQPPPAAGQPAPKAKGIGIVFVALVGSWMSERYSVAAILLPLGVMQGLAVAAALLIHESGSRRKRKDDAREAQVIVGTCLVLGSAIGPAVSSILVGPLGYRGLFAALAGLGAVATAIVVFFVPETLVRPEEHLEDRAFDARAGTPDLLTVP